MDIVSLLVEAGLASSKREARTFIESGAVSIDGEKREDPNHIVEKGSGSPLRLLRRGKKHLVLFRVI